MPGLSVFINGIFVSSALGFRPGYSEIGNVRFWDRAKTGLTYTRRVVRVVDRAALEMLCPSRAQGSNPWLSARIKMRPSGRILIFLKKQEHWWNRQLWTCWYCLDWYNLYICNYRQDERIYEILWFRGGKYLFAEKRDLKETWQDFQWIDCSRVSPSFFRCFAVNLLISTKIVEIAGRADLLSDGSFKKIWQAEFSCCRSPGFSVSICLCGFSRPGIEYLSESTSRPVRSAGVSLWFRPAYPRACEHNRRYSLHPDSWAE